MSSIMLPLPNGLKLHAKVWGPDNGVPVLALHGWMDNAASFDGLAPLLPECKIVSLDIVGHGFSDHLPGNAHYLLFDMVPAVDAVLDQLGWTRCHLIGHSMGGVIAQMYAATYPERVDKLVSVDVLGPLPRSESDIVEKLGRYSKQFFQPHKAHRRYPTLERAAKVRQSYGTLSDEAAMALVKGGMRLIDGNYSWTFDSEIRNLTLVGLTEAEVRVLLEATRCPVCVILAHEGVVVKYPVILERVEYLQQAEQYVLPGGHHLHMDDPQPVAQVIRNFFVTI